MATGKGRKATEAIRQIVVIHRNHGSLDKEAYSIKFEGPVLTDAGLERLAKAIRSALRKQRYKIIASEHTAALHGGLGWGLRR
jgi:DNA-binding NarL/FixJ family response regulator